MVAEQLQVQKWGGLRAELRAGRCDEAELECGVLGGAGWGCGEIWNCVHQKCRGRLSCPAAGGSRVQGHG